VTSRILLYILLSVLFIHAFKNIDFLDPNAKEKIWKKQKKEVRGSE